ncbi:Uu.00g057950.m01.CDS01 [Anthostomella pinea]|uniref:Uu.00g057950.m01.CDS01 n=1 Tax=Anthostomella pinea TaxID=933095 RepID=A0AAI8VL80_9PEZI|nr:Uu.00g057950.m01.CDS01 [Anthostomella pinea]
MAKSYNSVALDEEPFLPQEDGLGEKYSWKIAKDTIPERIQKWSPHWMWLGHAVLLSTSLTLFALSFCANTAKMSDSAYTQRYSAWSPAASAVKYETQHFDLPAVAEGPFMGKGDDVDAKWDYISDIGDTMISREEMLNLGLNPDISLAITDPEGKPGYRVAVEVFHQLHCLNLLRQNLYKDYYAPMGGDTAAPHHDLEGHLDHCIEALRQFVMCQGDVGVFSFNYPFGDGDPWPDYSTPHTCRNFESIRQWAVDHTIPQAPGEPEH